MPVWVPYIVAGSLAAVGLGFAVAGARLRIESPPPLPGQNGGGLGGDGRIGGVEGPGGGVGSVGPIQGTEVAPLGGQGELSVPKAYPAPFVLGDPASAKVVAVPPAGHQRRVQVDLYVENKSLGWNGSAQVEGIFDNTGLNVEQISGPKDGQQVNMKPISTTGGPWVFAGFRTDGQHIQLVLRAAPVPVVEGGYPAFSYAFAAGPPPHDFRATAPTYRAGMPILNWASIPWNARYAWRLA